MVKRRKTISTPVRGPGAKLARYADVLGLCFENRITPRMEQQNTLIIIPDGII
ncbi:hypothetical protein DEV91_12856 [Phyllobacterium brassicacearum]|nr:hypothetical protein DEV91_12856 [Phyllobacterium brassicacearum]